MKKILFVLILLILFLLNTGLAQNNSNFSGKWKLDKTLSVIDEDISKNIKSMSKSISHINHDLKIETLFEFDGELDPLLAQLLNSPQTISGISKYTEKFKADGQEVEIVGTNELDKHFPFKQKVSFNKDGNLEIIKQITFQFPEREEFITFKEIWKLAENKLIINQEIENTIEPEENKKLKWVFVKTY